jgi:hypothetical protein
MDNVSETSFGHTGFTSNIAWVDPKLSCICFSVRIERYEVTARRK